MKLLSLPWEFLVFNILGIFVCLGIMVSAICRLNSTHPRLLQINALQAFYVLMGFWAFGTFLNLMRGHLIGFHNAAAGAAFLLHLYMTYEHWEKDDPTSRPLDWGMFRC